MFVVTALVYPCLLAVLCLGAGLLIDCLSGGFLPSAVLIAVGAAALIALSQLTTYLAAIAPATPYLLAAFALAGFSLGRARTRVLARGLWELPWKAAVPTLAYLFALAPVLLAGRATFSSYMALADSAVHMMGADFLLRHGQHFAHLDLRNSYGQFINDYYNTSYPSGADTFFGGSAFLLRVPLIWAFQPFNAFMLATATGPAWLLARRIGLDRLWAAPAALTVTLPALVYGYELVASVKEITALSMILTLGSLVALHPRWLRGPPSRAIPFALVLAGGISALGVAFGAWSLAAVAVLLVVAVDDLRAARQSPAGLLGLLGTAAIVALICAWPTWLDFSGSLRVAQNIASTSNPGNLPTPLRTIQVFGIWLRGSYKQLPTGTDLTLTHALVLISLFAVLLGAVRLIRVRAYALAGWLALMFLVWLAVSQLVTNWANAKTLMLTSPAVMLMAWAGVAALRASPFRRVLRPVAALVAFALIAGVLVSDAMQYHSSNLAPTARYQELASLNKRFAGQGPTLFTDFDEYALYELRNLDIGGPDFAYPPASLASLANGYGEPVDLDRASPSALESYPLIVTRRDPAASRPPSAYDLLWQGAYYEVWRRRPGAASAIAHVALGGPLRVQCAQIARLARLAGARGAELVAARSPTLVRIPLAGTSHPRSWGHEREGLVMSRPGRLAATFALPAGGSWELWLQGQFMPTVELSVDGRPPASISGQLDGNSLVPDTITALVVRLSPGRHRLSLVRRSSPLAPGDGGSAVLDAIFLTPAQSSSTQPLLVAAPAAWPSLCGRPLEWIELVHGRLSEPRAVARQ
ncbi:MAG: hypothetical protein ABSG95_13655 [Solirubrobacteraceae bacterium]|jgi:hypothetical protein